MVYLHLLIAVTSLEQLQKISEKLVAKVIDVLFRILADNEHLADVALGLGMHLEAVGISALLFADLAVPSQALKTFGLELVAQVLGRADLCLGHFGLVSPSGI